jgi:hypothetical protein
VEIVEELGIPELNSKQIEELCSVAEKAAREYVLSKVPSKRIDALNISVETEGAKPVTLTIEVDVSLSPLMKNSDVQKLVDETVKEAYASAEEYLRKLKCRSQK